MCYKLPDDTWQVTSPGFIGKKCPTNVEGQNILDSGTTCWYDRGAGTVSNYTCPTGQVQKALDCYQTPPTGYNWTTPGGLLIGKICPTGINDSGTTCWYDRGVGTVPTYTCPTGQVQKALDCYQAPPTGYNWTTPGGLLIGKICPTGINDSGTTCWYDRGVGTVPTYTCPTGQVQKALDCYQAPPAGYDWTTPGGLLIGKVCPAGTTDTGTTCVYGRGAGRLPDKKPCSDWDSSWRDDGTSCWSDADIYGKGCCCTVFGCCGNCKAGYNDDGCTCRKIDVGIKKNLFERQYCSGSNEELIDALCYPKAQAGFTCVGPTCSMSKDVKTGTRIGLSSPTCPTDRQLEDNNTLCYKKPQTGYNCKLTICDFGKDVKPGTRVGPASTSCPTDRQLEDNNTLCYKKPQTGYNCKLTICDYSKDVKTGTRMGTATQSCPTGKVLEGPSGVGLCYTPPKTGFKCTATMCDYSKQVQSQIGTLPMGCPDNRVLNGRLCYPACTSGYERRGDNLEYCSTICPTDYTNIGIGGCQKPTLELIKVGTCPTGYTKSSASCTK